MEKGNLQKLRVVFVISPLKQLIPADSCRLILVKLKRYHKYRGYVYFEPVLPNVLYQALNYLKTHKKYIFISEGLSSKERI